MPSLASVLPSAVLALATAAAAQSWAIPARGVAEYRRTIDRLELTAPGKEPARRPAAALFGPIWPPPLLFAGELDDRGAKIERGPWDLRAVARYLGFDLSTATFRGQRRVDLPRVRSFGDLHVVQRFAPGEAGRQVIVCEIEGRPADRQPGENSRYVDSHIAPHTGRELHGELRIERRIAPGGGHVAEMTAALDVWLDGRPGDGDASRLRIDETWTLRRMRENRDAEFEAAVHESIRLGAAWVHRRLGRGVNKELGRGDVGHAAKSANSGRLALAILTLLKAGYRDDDPVLAAALAELRARRIEDTYSLGVALMALEALYTPPTEREDLLAGVIERPYARQPSAEDRARIEEWAAAIRANLDRRVDPAYTVRFNYTAASRYDNSVTQYGLLGLYAAQLCGVEQAPRFWRAAAEHWIENQCDARGSAELALVSNREFRDSASFDAERRAARGVRTGAAGWGYQKAGGGRPTRDYGSMTVAGLTGLAVAESALRMAGSPVPAEAGEVRRRAFAWLVRHARFDTNPNDYRGDQRWLYYYLYGLERACELNDVALISDRDWYFEGASTLLALQDDTGMFKASAPSQAAHGQPIERVCFAVLFLRKESLPVYTQR